MLEREVSTASSRRSPVYLAPNSTAQQGASFAAKPPTTQPSLKEPTTQKRLQGLPETHGLPPREPPIRRARATNALALSIGIAYYWPPPPK